MTTITKERLLTIKQWRETYGPGSNVVLPAEEAEELARIALAALDELEKMQAQSSKWCEAFHKAVSVGARYEERIAELELKLESADKLQDSAFRHGLQHGFSLGQTDNQAGFEECLSAYGTGKGE